MYSGGCGERGGKNERRGGRERKTISRVVPQRQASMTLYFSSSRAEEEINGLQEDKNIGKGKARGREQWKFEKEHRGRNEYEKIGAE